MTKEKEEHIKPYINKCLKIGIEPISVNDSKLFTHFFEKYKREFHYADSWFYLTQAVNGIGEHAYRLGFKYHVEECLFAIGIFESPHTKKIHFHIVNPIGQNINQHLDDLINMLFNITKTPVHLKKLEFNLIPHLINSKKCKILTTSKRLKSYWWHKNAPIEDDTYPELILDIDLTLSMLNEKGRNEVRDKFKRFKNQVDENEIEWRDVDDKNKKDAVKVIDNFFKFKREYHVDISTSDDYKNMIETVPYGEKNKNYLQKIVYIKNDPLALVCTEEIKNSNCHGLYSNLSIYQESDWLSYYVIVETLKNLKELGIKYINLGGSETVKLHDFKKKFRPIQERYSYWLVFDKN